MRGYCTTNAPVDEGRSDRNGGRGGGSSDAAARVRSRKTYGFAISGGDAPIPGDRRQNAPFIAPC